MARRHSSIQPFDVAAGLVEIRVHVDDRLDPGVEALSTSLGSPVGADQEAPTDVGVVRELDESTRLVALHDPP